MYRGFTLDISENPFKDSNVIGAEIAIQNNRLIEASLKQFITMNGNIDADKLKMEWFPDVNTEIFISHSHSDLQLALSFAGWLKKQFNLSCFIDSSMWKYADDLLWLIDIENCYDKDSKTFDYNKRNITTSNVHMILANALTKMIDKSECFFFIKSNNSILPDNVTDKTHSPWLFHELEIAKMIRKKLPTHHRNETKMFTKAERQQLNEANQFIFQVDLNSFPSIGFIELISWMRMSKNISPQTALDKLYSLIPLTKINDLL